MFRSEVTHSELVNDQKSVPRIKTHEVFEVLHRPGVSERLVRSRMGHFSSSLKFPARRAHVGCFNSILNKKITCWKAFEKNSHFFLFCKQNLLGFNFAIYICGQILSIRSKHL